MARGTGPRGHRDPRAFRFVAFDKMAAGGGIFARYMEQTRPPIATVFVHNVQRYATIRDFRY